MKTYFRQPEEPEQKAETVSIGGNWTLSKRPDTPGGMSTESDSQKQGKRKTSADSNHNTHSGDGGYDNGSYEPEAEASIA